MMKDVNVSGDYARVIWGFGLRAQARAAPFPHQYARVRVMGFDGVGNTHRARYADGGFTAVKAEIAPESYGQVDGALARIGKPCKLRRQRAASVRMARERWSL